MKKTATLLFIVFALLMTFSASAQVYKFKSTGFINKEIVSGTKWSEWTPWKELGALITLDLKEQRLKIYTAETQIYDFIDFKTPNSNIDTGGDISMIYTCIDDFGDTCTIKIERIASRNNQLFLSIIYSNYIIIHTIEALY